MFKHWVTDSFPAGLLLGCIPVLTGYFSWIYYPALMPFLGPLRFSLSPPGLQLVILALSLIVFRFMIVKWNMTKTGKGFFILLFAASVVFAFLGHRKLI